MIIGLLECDHILKKYQHIVADYRDLFKAFLPDFEFRFYDVCNNQFPESIHECDGWMCTGSKHSVYEEIDWIKRLKIFIKELFENDKKYVGICFGHQLLAASLGGKVWKSDKGWCVGVHSFEVIKKEAWMTPFQSSFNLLMMCQDQVFVLPEQGEILAQSADCQIGMFRVGDHMLSIQAHPEFLKAYTQALMEDRIERIGKQVVENGISSLEMNLDVDVFRRWVINFFRSE
ncbi:MAG: amidotransferase [Bacteroidetes bacterium]|jgi:GMP synthase-like glutamine amidotransferase|nr:amidotransferase [Bacteroidota bacterium]MDF1863517.1 hypothetical protein [Saprospiraceae bacterium]